MKLKTKAMYKNCKVVMLPTNKSVFHLNSKSNLILTSLGQETVSNLYNTIPHHLYILSDDEIKEGDWCYQTVINKIIQCPFSTKGCNDDHRFAKIIATTDSSLGKRVITYTDPHGLVVEETKYFPLHSIPQSFIDKYVSEYNKGNKIEEVMVEYEERKDSDLIPYCVPKLNSDNTINIKAIKDSWTREEVIELCASAHAAGSMYRSLSNWIKFNL